MKIYGIIYLFINRINLKGYTGQTIKSFEKRCSQHQSKSEQLIDQKIDEYGWDNFDKYIIDVCYTNQEDLNTMECHYIDYFNTKTTNQGGWGYNVRDGGSNGALSDETKQRMSDSKTGENNPMFGKKRPDVAAAMSIIMSGKTGANNPMFGKTGEANPNFKRIRLSVTHIQTGDTTEYNDGIGNIAKILEIKNPSNISKCLNAPNKCKSANGYTFSLIT